MAHEPAEQPVKLPLTIMTLVDLNRLSRELANIEDFNVQSTVRSPGKQPTLPRTSRGLEELASQNNLSLLIEADRATLKTKLDNLREHAPVIHMSFASDPSPSFLTKLVTWLRNEIHPSIIVNVGLQPGIAGGCVVRTANKYFDFSLRKHLQDSSQLLGDSLKKAVAGTDGQ